MEVKLKIYFIDDAGTQFMGIGVYWLLLGIKKHGSIRKAAEEMKLSYVKAHSMLNNLEDHLGIQVLTRKKGGDTREGTVLTPAGDKLIRLYRGYQDKVKDFAFKEFELFKEEFDAHS